MGPFKLLPLNYGFPFFPSHCVPKSDMTFKKDRKWRPGGSDRLLGHFFVPYLHFLLWFYILTLHQFTLSLHDVSVPSVFLFAVIIVFSLFFLFIKKHFQILYRWKVLYKYILLTYITRFNWTAVYLWERPEHVSACVLLSPHSPTLSFLNPTSRSRGQCTQRRALLPGFCLLHGVFFI